MDIRRECLRLGRLGEKFKGGRHLVNLLIHSFVALVLLDPLGGQPEARTENMNVRVLQNTNSTGILQCYFVRVMSCLRFGGPLCSFSCVQTSLRYLCCISSPGGDLLTRSSTSIIVDSKEYLRSACDFNGNSCLLWETNYVVTSGSLSLMLCPKDQHLVSHGSCSGLSIGVWSD